MGVICHVLAHSTVPEPGADAGYLGPLLGAVVGHEVADRVPDLGAEFGVGDVVERVPGHEQPSEDCAQ